ncbi:amino acid ABC transporter permease [Arthrobacter sp. MA-N2]|uniref:amino acid ABC transporter permease n=1 Tax=Arthrobacter sp. MA-N2 TaxID=1101188 RepID=UPI0004B91CDB|nr:amino acid ABC transporter permease [Arthrobacter sp. MA-N2]
MTTSQITAQHVNAEDLPVVPRRHLGRWAAAAVIVAVAAVFLQSVITNPRFGWTTVGQYLGQISILNGLLNTLLLTVSCMAIGIVLGIILAIMRQSANPILRGAAFAYTSFFRGTPVLVQILFWFNLAALYPVISFGIPGVSLDANALITPFAAAILGLGLNEAAYMAEIVRAGIIAVDGGQNEAGAALGMTKFQTMYRVILPQAMRVIIPPTGNEFIGLLKTSSLVSVIAVPDLLYSSQIIYSRNFQTIPLLIVASIWYLLATTILSTGQFYIERHFARGTKNMPMTPLQQVRHFFRTHAKPLAPANDRKK